MIYIAEQLIQIFSVGPATGIRGGTRGPRGPKKNADLAEVATPYRMLFALSFSSVYLFCFELYPCLLCAGMTQILKTGPPESL